MWGSPERAHDLAAAVHNISESHTTTTTTTTTDELLTILWHVTGPAHIPLHDPRWQELLAGYDVWVHVEATIVNSDSLRQHAARSSNLAALAWHVTRLVSGLQSNATDMTNKLAVVGKARATAGAVRLLRILLHTVMAEHDWRLGEACLKYHSRDGDQLQQNVAPDLLHSLLSFLLRCDDGDGDALTRTPEIYDTTINIMELLVVLFSTQLYQPMQSSFMRNGSQSPTFMWTLLMNEAKRRDEAEKHPKARPQSWTPRALLAKFLDWQTRRPVAPPRSIQNHVAGLAEQVVVAKGEKRGTDGMYETYQVVTANAATASKKRVEAESAMVARSANGSKTKVLLDATKGVLVLSSSIILLPFRLVSLALGLLGSGTSKGFDQAQKQQLQNSLIKRNTRTKDVIWLTESLVADLSSCILLLLLSNDRAGDSNPFRRELASMCDNRWEDTEGLPDLPGANGESVPLISMQTSASTAPADNDSFSANFEAIFTAFGDTVHTEVGSLLLYNVLQASPNFSESMAVRSDLDRLVLPILRTLYFSSSSRVFASRDFVTSGGSSSSKKFNLRSCPFRSQSQLYVLIILLLLFSQDSSFGADAFRRVAISNISWYKERQLKSISLGSVIILVVLRMLTFNLNRMVDPFLMSNCCAVLMNLSPTMVELHDYAAMRLVAVTVAFMKRYEQLTKENPNDDEEDLSTPTAMHGEVSRTLLQVIKNCLNPKTLDKNLHLIYALVYHQTDLKRVVAAKGCPFRKSEYARLVKVAETASTVIDKEGDGRSAVKALHALTTNIETVRKAVAEKKKRSSNDDDFTFTYEEETDPEVFFVPYVWEVIVCVTTAASVEWNKDNIQVFSLLEDVATNPADLPQDTAPQPTDPTKFAKDVSDVV